MKNKYKELSKNAFLFSIGSIGSKLITLLLVPLYTSVLTTSEYGAIDVVNTTVSLLVPVLTINVQDAVLRFSLDDDYNSDEILTSSTRVIGFSSLILALVVCFLRFWGIIRLDWIYVAFLILSFMFVTFQNVFSMYLRAKDRIPVIVTSGILTTLLTCLLSLVFLLGVKIGATGFIAANLLASLFGFLYTFIFGRLKNAIAQQFKPDTLVKMFVYSAPLLANSVAWWINSASDRYILTFFCGITVNGIYAVSYKIPTILATLQGFFYNAWSVSAIKEFDSEDTDGFVGNIYEIFSCISIIACSILVLINPILAKVLFAKEFYVAYHYVPLLLVGTVFNGLALFEGCLFTAVKKTKAVSNTTIIGAGINTILNISLIPFLGAYGAAAATMVGYIAVWGVRTYSLSKIVRMKVGWIRHLICLGLVIVQCGVSMFNDSALLQVLVIVVLAIVQRKTIMRFFNLNH